MTKIEKFEMIANGEVNEEVMEWAAEMAEKEKEAAKRAAERKAEKDKENEPIDKAILDYLDEEPKVASEIAEVVGVSTQKASARLRKLVEAGSVDKTEVKDKGRKVNGYTKA